MIYMQPNKCERAAHPEFWCKELRIVSNVQILEAQQSFGHVHDILLNLGQGEGKCHFKFIFFKGLFCAG